MFSTSPKGRGHAVEVVIVEHAYSEGWCCRNTLCDGGESWVVTLCLAMHAAARYSFWGNVFDGEAKA